MPGNDHGAPQDGQNDKKKGTGEQLAPKNVPLNAQRVHRRFRHPDGQAKGYHRN